VPRRTPCGRPPCRSTAAHPSSSQHSPAPADMVHPKSGNADNWEQRMRELTDKELKEVAGRSAAGPFGSWHPHLTSRNAQRSLTARGSANPLCTYRVGSEDSSRPAFGLRPLRTATSRCAAFAFKGANLAGAAAQSTPAWRLSRGSSERISLALIATRALAYGLSLLHIPVTARP
jgi:hypothetical protein